MELDCLRERIKKANRGLTGLEKGTVISSSFGDISKRIISKANEALENLIVLPGTGAKPFFVGSPISWLDNPTGNPEYTFQLNRMVSIKNLSEAFSITKDEKYAIKAISELIGWIENVKCPQLKNEKGDFIIKNFDGPESRAWRALEVGIRCYRTWPVIIEQLVYSSFFTSDVLEKIVSSIRTHLEILYNISPLLWPNADHNHYIMENLGLYSMAAMFPQLDPDKTYLDHASKQLKRSIEVQCTAEGGQIEGCPSYHNGSVYWFSLKNNIEERYSIEIDPEYTKKLDNMFNHSLHASRCMGGNIPWGDSHTTPVETCSVAAIGLYLATGKIKPLQNALYMASKEILDNDLAESIFRVIDPKRLEKDYLDVLRAPLKPNLPLVHYASSLDQVFIRTGWEKDDMTFMTACRTPVKNMHAHIDPCSFDLSAYNDVLIADPGVYTYKAGEERYRFKSTMFHSCVSINAKDAWEYKGPWKYGEQRKGNVLSVTKDEEIIKIVEKHENYLPIILTRVFYIIGPNIIILDIAENMRKNDKAYISFHLDSKKLEILDSSHVSTRKESNAELDMAFSSSAPFLIECAKISDRNDTWRDSTILRLVREGTNSTLMHASFLAPRKKNEKRKSISISTTFNSENKAVGIDFKLDGKKSSLVYKLEG